MLRVTRAAVETLRGRLLKTRMWMADSPAKIADHDIVMAAKYIGVCFSLIAICSLGIIVGKRDIKGELTKFTVVVYSERTKD